MSKKLIEQVCYKELKFEKMKSVKTSIKNATNAGRTKGVKVRLDKYNNNEIIIEYNGLSTYEIEKLKNRIELYNYSVIVVSGLLIARKIYN